MFVPREERFYIIYQTENIDVTCCIKIFNRTGLDFNFEQTTH